MPKLPANKNLVDIDVDSLFTSPMLAVVPVDATGDVFADLIVESDLALPISLVWTGDETSQILCGNADLDGSGEVDFMDFAILSLQWQHPTGEPSADIAPDPIDGKVDIQDMAAIAENWLNTNCQK